MATFYPDYSLNCNGASDYFSFRLSYVCEACKFYGYVISLNVSNYLVQHNQFLCIICKEVVRGRICLGCVFLALSCMPLNLVGARGVYRVIWEL